MSERIVGGSDDFDELFSRAKEFAAEVGGGVHVSITGFGEDGTVVTSVVETGPRGVERVYQESRQRAFDDFD